MSIAHKGKNPGNKGKKMRPLTDEHKQKLREAQIKLRENDPDLSKHLGIESGKARRGIKRGPYKRRGHYE
jgi:hypothetical protein